jgi:hypothetical protein
MRAPTTGGGTLTGPETHAMQLTRIQARRMGIAILALLTVAGAAGCGSSDSSEDRAGRTIELVEAPPATTSSTPRTSTAAAPSKPARRPRRPAAPTGTQRQRLLAALKPFDAKVAPITTENELTLTAPTPGDAAGSLAAGELAARAGEIFRAVYREAKYEIGTVIAFRGGVGKDPNAMAAIFNIDSGQAAKIDWAADDTLFLVDWSEFLLTVHPSLR